MKDTIVTPINNGTRLSEALPNFVANKHIVFMNEWTRARKITGGKRVPSESSQWGLDDCPSFLLMNYDRDGKERPDLSRTRYDTSHPACPKDENGKPKKYKLNGAPGFSPIFAPMPDSYAKFAAAKVKWIAEGEGGTLALAQLGLPVLGIGGCQNWREKGTDDLSPYLDGIHAGDTVMIAGDGDVRTNMQVREGYGAFMYAIRMRRAIPQYKLLPESAGQKDGIDDELARSEDPMAALDRLRSLTDLRSLDDFPLATYEDLIDRPFPEWIVDGLVQPGELTAIVGATSCGKSFLVQDLMSSVARGLPKWFDKDINASGLVVHINFEGRGLSTRMKAYAKHHSTKPFPYFALEQSVILPDEQETDRLIRSIKNKSLAKSLPVVLVTVDTVNRALGGGDENDSKAMGTFIRSADRIRDAFPQAGILLVHHLGKDAGRGARGHSSFSAAVGGELLIEVNADKSRTVSITKQRDWTTDTKFHFKLDQVVLSQNSKGVDITSCVVMPIGAAPIQDTSDAAIYGKMYYWNLTINGNKPTCWETLRRNKPHILGAGMKMSPVEFKAVMEMAIVQGLITETKLPRGGRSLVLHAPKQTKY
jgi:hypothetical protein